MSASEPKKPEHGKPDQAADDQPAAPATNGEPSARTEGQATVQPGADDTDAGMKRGIQSLLAERMKLDEELHRNYSKRITVMFTDIKGSTSFFERRGDIEGRIMLEKHNSLLFPIIEEHGGVVIKTIGDAIMSKFDLSEQAVTAAMAMQRALADHNKDREESNQIHIRIGVNTGLGMVEDDDVFGDVVNTAARVESLCEPDCIVIGESTYREVRTSEDIICRLHREAKVRGKESAIRVYRVVWAPEQELLVTSDRSRGATARRSARKVLVLEVSREGDRVKVSVDERESGQSATVRHYEDCEISPAEIEERCAEVRDQLNRANLRGEVSPEILEKLKSVGQVLFDALITSAAKQTMLSSEAEDLVISIDERLVQVPWELLYDGRQFLCLRFNMGRLVSTRQQVAASRPRQIARPLKMLIMADPRGDLQASHAEGTEVRAEVEQQADLVNASMTSGEVRLGYVKEKLRNFDLIHYAGHADYDTTDPGKSGWLLKDGKLQANDILAMAGSQPMPALVFSNACQSGQTDEWNLDDAYGQRIYGLANAFLLAGVQHYIGTFWEILDDPGRLFAREFYKELMSGSTVGEAVKEARINLVEKYGEETIVWASYMLYGDPSVSYLELASEADEADADLTRTGKATEGQTASDGTRAEGIGEISFRSQSQRLRPMGSVVAAFLVLCLLVGLYLIVQRGGPGSGASLPSDPAERAHVLLRRGDPVAARSIFDQLSRGERKAAGLNGLAAVALAANDYQQATSFIEQAEKIDPDNVYSNVVRGSLLFNQGKINEASAAYREALKKPHGAEWQRSEAYERLGRILAATKKPGEALKAYDAALNANAKNARALSNKAALLLRQGKAGDAAALLQQAKQLNPNDRISNVLLRDAERRVKQQSDQQRQDRIDRLTKELAEQFRLNQGPAATAEPPWTSRPLALAVIEFSKRGVIAARDGEEDVVMIELSDALAATQRLTMVDRSILDQVLAELRLSAANLTDSATALRLGRILGARLILHGSFIRRRDGLRVVVRLTETETTRVRGSVTASMQLGQDPDALVQLVTRSLLERVRQVYPLRGRIASVGGTEVNLNIGADVGVEPGQRFEVFELPAEALAATRPGAALGSLEVTQVGAEESTAKVLTASRPVQANMGVREVTR